MSATAPVLVAPDKFKGTLSATDVAAALAAGVRAGGRDAEELPVADGGEGTADALLRALGGELRTAEVEDALGRPVSASYVLLDDGRTAVVEAAEASGLWRLREDDLDAWAATTRGTGELIAEASSAGAQRVIVACGGTATTDGGRGALDALEATGARPELVLACDARTPFEAAAQIFAPQKGADPATVRRLRRRLAALAAAAPRDPRGTPMTGCGGGLSGGLWAHRGARLVAGGALVLDALGFDVRLRECAFVITGEGRLDDQTLAGKAVAEVATRCRQVGVWCHAVVGRNELDAFGARLLDLASVREAGDRRALRRAGAALAENGR